MYPNYANKGICRSVFDEKFLKIGFSEHGEDEFVRSFFWDQIIAGKPGLYLDIGCFHESLHSNTKLLSLVGWSGVAVDANPELEEPWKNVRRGDVFYNVAVRGCLQDVAGESLSFYRFHGGEINTAELSAAKRMISEGFSLRDVIKVPSLRIDELAELVEARHPGFRPDFVTIDLEECNYLDDFGRFLEVLKRPRLVCFEWINKGFDLNNFFGSPEWIVLNENSYEVKMITPSNVLASPKLL